MLYKYKKLITENGCIDDRIIESINKNTIYVSSIESLNDPFEKIHNIKPYSFCSPQERQELLQLDEQHVEGFEGFGKELIESYDDMAQTLTDLDQTIIETTECGIFSMSEINDSILLWSHYADNHAGICIGYDKQEFIASKSCIKVKYKKKVPVYDGSKRHRNPYLELYKYKFNVWNYEKEWRYVDFCTDEEIECPSSVRAVYFGLRVSDDIIKKFKNRITADIKYYRACFFENNSQRDYKLVFIEC